jgi:hypothetical protein
VDLGRRGILVGVELRPAVCRGDCFHSIIAIVSFVGQVLAQAGRQECERLAEKIELTSGEATIFTVACAAVIRRPASKRRVSAAEIRLSVVGSSASGQRRALASNICSELQEMPVEQARSEMADISGIQTPNDRANNHAHN